MKAFNTDEKKKILEGMALNVTQFLHTNDEIIKQV
jgi:hypothetical protein